MPDFFISDQAAFGLSADIAAAFRDAGRTVTLFSGVPEKNPLVGIAVKKIPPYEKTSTLRRIFTWLHGAFALWREFRKNPDAELFIISNPPIAPLLPLVLKNKKISLLVWDIWPDALVHTKTLSARHPIVKIWAWLNRRAFAHAQTVFTISDGLADALSVYVLREKIRVVPLWADTALLKPLPKNENRFLREHALAGKFVVMYSGNIGNTHPVEKLVDIANLLREHDDIAFVIIGDGGKRETVRRRIEETGARNVLLLPFQSREMFAHALAAADVSVVTLEVAASQVSVPSKTYSALAVGSPLLCLAGKNSELASLVHGYDVGEIFSPEEIRAAADWILSLKNDPARRDAMRSRALAASLRHTPENAKRFILDHE